METILVLKILDKEPNALDRAMQETEQKAKRLGVSVKVWRYALGKIAVQATNEVLQQLFKKAPN